MLSLVLLALVAVFGLLLGERFFSVGALQSMAFQLPELGILSLAMMVTLLSGGLNLSIIATANLCALTMAWVLTTQVPGAQGFMWGGWQVIAVLAGIAVAAVDRAHQRLRHRLSRRVADPGDARHDDDVQGPVDRPDARQRHLRLSRADRLPRQRHARRRAGGAADLPRAVRADGGAAQQEPVRPQDLHDRLEREGDALFRRRHQARPARRLCAVEPARRRRRRWS